MNELILHFLSGTMLFGALAALMLSVTALMAIRRRRTNWDAVRLVLTASVLAAVGVTLIRFAWLAW